jgi:hypothetical protein
MRTFVTQFGRQIDEKKVQYMLLKNPQRMAELFVLLDKLPTTIYQNSELNEALNNALLLEEYEQPIIALGCYSIKDVLYGRFYWYTKFLCRYETIYGKNGSMEQAQFKIIEAMDYAGVIESDTLEAIEQELGCIE